MKYIFSLLLVSGAFTLSGCADAPLNPYEAIVDGGASAWAEYRPSGADVSWTPTSYGNPDLTWEGYPEVLQRGRTYEATVQGWKRVRLSSHNPAFNRFVKNNSVVDDGVDVRIIDLNFTLRKGDLQKQVVIPIFFPLSEFVEVGQTVLVKPIGESNYGFLQVSVAGKTRYTEGYPSFFAPNRVYLGKVNRVVSQWIGVEDVAYPRLLAAVSLPQSPVRIEAQVLSLTVMTDDSQKLVTVIVANSPIYHSGDVVYYRTFGNPLVGFADVRMKRTAATGNVLRIRPSQVEESAESGRAGRGGRHDEHFSDVP